MSIDADGILVSWVSVNHRAAPLLDALSHPKSILNGRIGKLVICYRDGPSDDPWSAREKEAMRATVRTLRRDLAPVCPEIVRRAWKTKAPPTDHSSIRPFAEKVLRDARKDRPEAPIYIHVSPGTPAMHAVWLVLASTGFIDDPVHLVQGVGGKDRPPADPPVGRVDFPLDTWLQRYRRQRPSRPSAEDDGHLWDPRDAQSPALRRVMARLERFAPLRVPVLILGERGTGKTTLAGQLRARSPFQGTGDGTWPVVVCGQFRVNPQLARSELFGHKKGAFTGAVADRKGLLERSDGDTVFFDEIGDIDRDTQRLLVAAIEGRGFTRLGDDRVRHSRFRLVCATNRPVTELRGEALDQDFFDRLAMFVLRVPPLRDCGADLPALWRSILTRCCREAEVEPDGWQELEEDKALIGAMMAHRLPGNLRDLQRAAFHALAALESGGAVADAVTEARASLEQADLGQQVDTLDAEARLPLEGGLDAELARVEAMWLAAALGAGNGNQSEAARLLGLPRKTFTDRVNRRLGGGHSPE